MSIQFADWTTYFRHNAAHLADLSWDDPYRLTEREKRAVGRSLQHFQRGESSEGKYLYDHADDLGDEQPGYEQAVAGFIAEEQGHAQVLGQFLDKQNIPRLRYMWIYGVFRRLGQLGGLEHTTRVLLSAEIVAAVYFRAVYHATYSGLLQQICLRILRDEQMHLNFQCFTLSRLRRRGSRVGWWLRQQLHRGMMLGIATAAWLSYNRTFWAAGIGPVGFAAAVSDEWTRVQLLLRHPETNHVRPATPPPAVVRPAWPPAPERPNDQFSAAS